MQLMHVYVQKSISTTRPCSEASVSGPLPGVLNQRCVRAKPGALPRSPSLRASARSVAWLALAGAACAIAEPPWQEAEPFAGANLGWRPEISCRRLVTVREHSSEAARLTSGMFRDAVRIMV